MRHEGYSNISTQIPLALARRLDARVDADRRNGTEGHASRSNVIRAALAAFLADMPDPKAAADGDEAVARKYSRPREYRPRKRTIQPIGE